MTNNDKIASLSKSQELLLYLIQQKGGVIEDKTVLAKLLYFADFIHYAFHNVAITGNASIYTKQKQGPLFRNLTYDLEYLKSSGFLKEDRQFCYRTTEKTSKLALTENEKKTARFVLSKYGNLKWSELVAISHSQDPYLSANDGSVIEFFTAFNLVDEYPDYESFS